MTLEKIRAALPTHIHLTRGVHPIRKGDEYYGRAADQWFVYVSPGEPVYEHIRRPIPPHILDNQALWLWLDTVEGTEQTPPLEEIHKANLLAAWQNIAQAGRLYDKWLLEQMEDV